MRNQLTRLPELALGYATDGQLELVIRDGKDHQVGEFEQVWNRLALNHFVAGSPQRLVEGLADRAIADDTDV